MVHKKFIKKGGKVFGPYYYKNYRDKDGNTKTKYIGKSKPEKKKNPKTNLKSNPLLLLLLGFILFLLIFGFVTFFYSNLEKKSGGELRSEKNFFNFLDFIMDSSLVNVFLNVSVNNPPNISNIFNETFVCENNALNHSFIVQDKDKDALNFHIFPQLGLFFIYPSETSGGKEFTDAKIVSLRTLQKQDIDSARVLNNGWAVFGTNISVDDRKDVDSVKTNITLIEINNAPNLTKIGVRTIWTKGDNNSFYYQVDVNDAEDGNASDGILDFNLSFLNSKPFFELSESGVINITGNESLILSGNSTVYNLKLCVNDTGLNRIPSPNVSLCLPDDILPLTSCDNFSLTITRENRAPNITSYFPELVFDAKGTDDLYFNVSVYDPDGTKPDAYWYADSNFVKISSDNLSSYLVYNFGCDIDGEHFIKVVATDGELNDSIQWNISLSNVPCSSPPSGGGGGGGLFCKEEWVCEDWKQCLNLKRTFEFGILSKYYESLIKDRCNIFNYDEKVCGFQIRNCTDIKYCGTNYTKPGTIKECYYTELPGCKDNIKNCHDGGCEVLTDCGGPCEPCPTCDDKLQNQGEFGIDCGGPCSPCVEEPSQYPLLKLILFSSLFGLLGILLIILIIQLIRHRFFEKQIQGIFVRKKEIKKDKKTEKETKKNSKEIDKKKIHSVFLFLIFIFLILFFANLFIVNISDNRVIIRSDEKGGFLGSQSLLNGFLKNFADLFMINTISVVVNSFDNTNLVVWDDTDDTDKGERYTYCENYCEAKNKGILLWNAHFYANYSDRGNPISPLNGQCFIDFDDIGWKDMVYNPTSFLWEYNRSFSTKGENEFNITCEGDYNNLSILTEIRISNTEPYIFTDPGGFIDINGDHQKDILRCIEDIPCYYDFASNVSEDDLNDVLVYGYLDNENTTLTNFTINSNTGLLRINVTNSVDTGLGKKVELSVRDTNGPTKSAILEVSVQEVNDAPIFVNLEDKRFNMTQWFEYIINISDEENNFPFVLNISFMDCLLAEWSDRTNCTLFSDSQYNFETDKINISFMPTKDDVGVYQINFSVMDYNPVLGNATGSKVVNFTVLLVNEPPVFTYVCDNERKAWEDVIFSCWINATDVYELNNLTFSSNLSWFLDKKVSRCNISTGYNSSVNVNFILDDEKVGNWSINISVTDTGAPVKMNSTVINFFVQNKNDSVLLQNINNFLGYSGNDYLIQVNASDDDLLIPQSSDPLVYKENLRFFIKNELGNNINWINILPNGTFGSVKTVYLNFTSSVGLYFVNISVIDANSYSIDSQIFFINISGNSPPVWDNISNFSLNENSNFYLDLKQKVIDPDGDTLIFSFVNDTSFPSFSLINGVIDFVPDDLDVGQHILKFNATDGKTPIFKTLNFTVYNVDDNPVIKIPLQGYNISVVNSSVYTFEDNTAGIFFFVEDNDFLIPANQKNFYNENLSLVFTLIGPNSSLFRFVKDPFFPNFLSPNKSRYEAVFVPRKPDVGFYNISLNISDKGNLSNFYFFNLTITEIEHNPVLMDFMNYPARVNQSFYLDIQAVDIEDGNDSSGNLSYSYSFINGVDFINNNQSIFNLTNGQLNFTFNKTNKYHLNISVRDSKGWLDSGDFWIYVYGFPNITYPEYCGFNLKENVTSNLTLRAYHFIEDNLTYEAYLSYQNISSLKYNFTGRDNNTNAVFVFTPNLTDESYNGTRNLSLFVFNRFYRDLNDSVICIANINHTNAPVVFRNWIGDKSSTQGNVIGIDLKDYFSDIDHSDSFYNQTVDFLVQTGSNTKLLQAISPDWILSLSSSENTQEVVSISATDSEYNSISNNFTVEFITPPPTPRPSPSTQKIIVSLKIIFPDKVSAYANEKIEIPLSLFNGGQVSFKGLNLSSSAYKDGNISQEVRTSLDKTYFESLPANKRENLTLTVFFDTEKLGDYEVLVQAVSTSPHYSDWGKIHINLQSINESRVIEKLVFTEEFIVENPECIEIKELVDEAKQLIEKKDYVNAEIKTEQALASCKESISQVSIPGRRENIFSLSIYLLVISLVAVIGGIIYYFSRRKNLLGLKKIQVNKNI